MNKQTRLDIKRLHKTHTTREAAKELGTIANTLRLQAKSMGLTFKTHRGVIAKRKADIVRMAKAGKTCTQIGKFLNLRANSVYNFCMNYKIKLTLGKSRKLSHNIILGRCTNASEVEQTMIKIRRDGYIPVYSENTYDDDGRFIVGSKIFENYNAVLKFAAQL